MSQVNFDWRCGILEAADPATDREWCWTDGDSSIVETLGGEFAGTIDVPRGARVTRVKSLIRSRAKRVSAMT